MSLERLSELLFESSESIPNGVYVNLMNELRDIHRARPVVAPPPPRPLIRGVEDALTSAPVWGEWRYAVWDDDIVEDDDECIWTAHISHYAVWEIFNSCGYRKTKWEIEAVNRKSIKVKETILELYKEPNDTFRVGIVEVNRHKLITTPKIKDTIFNLNTSTYIAQSNTRPFTREEIIRSGWNPYKTAN